MSFELLEEDYIIVNEPDLFEKTIIPNDEEYETVLFDVYNKQDETKQENIIYKKSTYQDNQKLRRLCRIGLSQEIDNIINSGITYQWNEGLIGACEGGHINIIQKMISLGADDFNSGVFSASINNNIEVIKLLIDTGKLDYEKCLSMSRMNGVSEKIIELFMQSIYMDPVQIH